MNENNGVRLPLRITNGNCKMPCSGILGFVRLGRLKAPTPHYTTFFCVRKMLAHFPYRAQKNVSYLERKTQLSALYKGQRLHLFTV